MNYTYYKRYQPKKKRESSFFWLVIFLILAAIFLKSCFSSAEVKNEEKRDEAVLSINKGAAEVTVWGEDVAEPAASSQIILEGDKISTGEESYATMDFYNGTKVVLDQNTVVLFSEVKKDGNDDYLTLELQKGRVFVNEVPGEDGKMQVKLKTDVMNIISYQCQYMASNISDNEFLYVFNGEALPELVDKETLIEKVVVKSGQKIAIPDSKEAKLLSRESVTLVEDSEGDLEFDDFYLWNVRKSEPAANPGTLIEEPVQDVHSEVSGSANSATNESMQFQENVTQADSAFGVQIKVTSPVSPASIEKNGIAIEGAIVAGIAATVTVTWDGNNSPYTLKGFKAGGSTFRFVATDEYKNLKLGSNTYTVIAYDEAGNPSNTVMVKVNANF